MNKILQQKIEGAARGFNQKEGIPYALIGHVFNAFMEGADFALQNQWISVEEALPPERDEEDEQYSTNVFARTKDCIRYAYYDFYNESWCSVEGGYRFGGDVTHWMPIPSLEGDEK